MAILIDSHAHLDQIENLDEELKAAKDAGVIGIVAVGVDSASSKKNFEIVGKYAPPEFPRIFLGMGMHPGELKPDELPGLLAFMEENAPHLTVVGEIGLDFWYPWVRKDDAVKAAQSEVFRQMLAFAVKQRLPVSVHSRGKWQECFDEVKAAGVQRAVFHWFSGPKKVLDQIVSSGYFVSLTPSLAYSPESQQTAVNAPVEQTLLETDCPVFFKDKMSDGGFRSGPKDVIRTLQHYCRIKMMEERKAAEIILSNTRRFFDLPVA